jgi:carbon storage regulator CsrA
MLVLTRKRMESIKIGPNIVLKVLDMGAKTVRLGIEAPAEVRIVRGELAYDPPPVAEAAVDLEPDDDEPVILGPLTAEQFLKEFDDVLPGRALRRVLQSQRSAWTSAAR